MMYISQMYNRVKAIGITSGDMTAINVERSAFHLYCSQAERYRAAEKPLLALPNCAAMSSVLGWHRMLLLALWAFCGSPL